MTGENDMPSVVSGKGYFLRQSGRITGPYSMLKLTAMYRRGELKCEDMCSEDKIRWHYINLLFPALSPSAPIAVDEPAATLPDPVPPIMAPPRQEQFFLPPSADNAIPPSIPHPAKAPPRAGEETMRTRWLADIGRTIALVWDFREILQLHSGKAGRFLGIATVMHALLMLVIVLTFGKYYSSRFHWFFSPLAGLCLLVILWGAACLTGWSAARKSATAGKGSPPADWKICAAGFCVNYGVLAHGKGHLWVQALLVFIDSGILCSCVMQLRDFLEKNGKRWEVPAACTVLFLNPALAAVICVFTTLI